MGKKERFLSGPMARVALNGVPLLPFVEYAHVQVQHLKYKILNTLKMRVTAVKKLKNKIKIRVMLMDLGRLLTFLTTLSCADANHESIFII